MDLPDENIGKNLEKLCIRRGILKYLEGKIVNANQKKQMHKFVTVKAAIEHWQFYSSELLLTQAIGVGDTTNLSFQ